MTREHDKPTDTIPFQGTAIGVLLGSGLSEVADEFPTENVLRFDQIEGVGAAAVTGHRGEIRRSVVSGRPCLFVCGRRHFYEGDAGPVRELMTYLHRAGLRKLVVTSAAGSLVKSIAPGELVLVSDILDAQQRPQRGDRDDAQSAGRPSGPRRLALDAAVSRDLWVAASRAKVGLGRGSCVSCAGPAYETPAEVRALQETGASVVTMSGAPEIEATSRFGIRTAMIAVVTNWASGISTIRLRHEDVVDSARSAADRLRRIIVEFVGGGN